MKHPKRMNFTLDQKQKLLNETFNTKLSRSTIFKIQNKALRYSHKRICSIRPLNNEGNLSFIAITF